MLVPSVINHQTSKTSGFDWKALDNALAGFQTFVDCQRKEGEQCCIQHALPRTFLNRTLAL